MLPSLISKWLQVTFLEYRQTKLLNGKCPFLSLSFAVSFCSSQDEYEISLSSSSWICAWCVLTRPIMCSCFWSSLSLFMRIIKFSVSSSIWLKHIPFWMLNLVLPFNGGQIFHYFFSKHVYPNSCLPRDPYWLYNQNTFLWAHICVFILKGRIQKQMAIYKSSMMLGFKKRKMLVKFNVAFCVGSWNSKNSLAGKWVKSE